MKAEQLKNLRDAIDAHLRREKVEGRADVPNADWVWVASPNFQADGIEWRPSPKEPFKRWFAIGPNGDFINSFSNKAIALSYAKQIGGSLIELTETSRQSFKREPVRFWGTTAREESGVIWWPSNADAVKYVKNNGGRVAEFVEVVK